MNSIAPASTPETIPLERAWHDAAPPRYRPVAPRPSVRSLFLAIGLFLLTLCTAIAAGTQFAVTFAQGRSGSIDELLHAYALFYQHPAALVAGLPFAPTLLTILLAHELGHFFACRHHHIRASYPFFIPFPSLIGTFGAFILMRSPIRTNRSLLDVGASGPLVGFLFAVPALVYGVVHAKVIANIDAPSTIVFGSPLVLHLFAAILHPGLPASHLLIDPIGRAAWVGLFATSLNLLPAGQLDGGHVLRSISPHAHKVISWMLPFALVLLGFFGDSMLWYVWAAMLLILRFLPIPPIYDLTPLDPPRRFAAALSLTVFVASFMPMPIVVT